MPSSFLHTIAAYARLAAPVVVGAAGRLKSLDTYLHCGVLAERAKLLLDGSTRGCQGS